MGRVASVRTGRTAVGKATVGRNRPIDRSNFLECVSLQGMFGQVLYMLSRSTMKPTRIAKPSPGTERKSNRNFF